MGSYYIPNNNLKGESRILYIFTPKSLIYTAVGILLGLIIYFFFSLVGLKLVGIIIMGILGLTGYGIATIKIPAGSNSTLSKNVGGDSIDDIISRYILFNKNKKVYTYSIPRKEPNYMSTGISIEGIINKMVTPKTQNTKDTKEEK